MMEKKGEMERRRSREEDEEGEGESCMQQGEKFLNQAIASSFVVLNRSHMDRPFRLTSSGANCSWESSARWTAKFD